MNTFWLKSMRGISLDAATACWRPMGASSSINIAVVQYRYLGKHPQNSLHELMVTWEPVRCGHPLVSRGVQGQENIVVFLKKSRAQKVHVSCRVGCSPHAKRTAQTQLYIVLGLLLIFEKSFCTWEVTGKIWCAFQLVNLFLYPFLLYQPKETSPQMTLINCSWYIS